MNDKLLPCPFCGGEATLRKSAFFTCKTFAKCKKCGARTLEYSSASMEDAEMNAIHSWNTRKPMERIVEQLEEIKVIRCKDCDLLQSCKNVHYFLCCWSWSTGVLLRSQCP